MNRAPPASKVILRAQMRLPAGLGSLIGREAELESAARLLQEPTVRLLTLTGAGGVGKTRLAVEVATLCGSGFHDGGRFVPLGRLTDPQQVLPAIGHSLDFAESVSTDLSERLLDALRNRHFLLFLDNFEHVLPAAPMVAELLGACADLKVLVTSQAALHLAGEYEFPVLPLPVPASTAEFETLAGSPAVRLFVERAKAVSPDFHLEVSNAQATVEVCRRLDGLPLAIELAAPRIRVLTPKAMLVRLDRSLELLAGGRRDAPARQQALSNTLDWSYTLLDEEQRLALLQLTVFPASFTVETSERFLQLAAEASVLEVLGALVERGFLRREDTPQGENRLSMPVLIRQFLRERFLDSPAAAELAERHAMLQLGLVDSAYSGLRRRSSESWLNRMESERDSLAAAVGWFITSGRSEEALRMAAWLWRFWFLHGYVDECRRWLGEVLSMAPVPDTPDAAEALLGAGFAAHYQADYRAAESFFMSSLGISRRLHDIPHTAVSLNGLGGLARVRGDYAGAKRLYEEGLALVVALDDDPGVATLLERLGLVQWLMGEMDAAQESLSRALALCHEVGDRRGIVQALQGLGWFAINRGETRAAANLLIDALARSRSLGDRWNMARALYSLGLVSYRERDLDLARQRQVDALGAANQVGDKALMRACLEALAAVADAQGHHVSAAELLGAAAALAGAAPDVRSAVLESPVLDREYPGLVESVSAALSGARFVEAWDKGHASTPLQALDFALRHEESATGGHPEGLSDRELVVLRLVATGGTNAQIAHQLFLSIRTVDAHLRTIYRKLGVTSRAAATRFAVEHELT
ncbi:MAG TPA: tetratricopeptide repeat protein [Candidatus Dormibacteraeota bacterium]